MPLHVPTKVCIGGYSRVRGGGCFRSLDIKEGGRHYVWARRAKEQTNKRETHRGAI